MSERAEDTTGDEIGQCIQRITNPEVFDGLFMQATPRLLRMMEVSFPGIPAEVREEVAQDTWISAIVNSDQFGQRGNNGFAWLSSIAANRCRDLERRRRLRQIDLVDDWSVFEGQVTISPDPVESVMRASSEDRLDHFMRQNLGELAQDVLRLRYQKEMTFNEVGERLGMNSSQAKGHHRRAIAHLQVAARMQHLTEDDF